KRASEDPAKRNRGDREDCLLAQQHYSDLTIREAEHAKTCALSAALRQRDARAVVYHAQRDYGCEQHNDYRRYSKAPRHHATELFDHRAARCYATDERHCPQLLEQRGSRRAVASQVSTVDQI